MARVGMLTFSDGRDFVYRDLDPFTSRVEEQIAGRAGSGAATTSSAPAERSRRTTSR